MPWPETDVLRERVRFIEDLESCLYTMSELSERYGVSRKTAYKWADRYAVGGAEDLRDRSRTPHQSPRRTPEEVRERLIEAPRAPDLGST